MNNKPLCTICNQKPAGYRGRDVCTDCTDKIAKIYYTMKKAKKDLPPGTPDIENIEKANVLLAEYIDIPINIKEAEYINAPFYLHWAACNQAGHIGLKKLNGECWFCSQGDDQIKLHLTPRQEAIAAGDIYYTPATPCPYCTKIAPRHVANGRCKGCDDLRRNKSGSPGNLSPRQAAIAAGDKWYTPGKPCPRCNTTALRRVDNGQCRSCQPVKRTTRPAAHVNTLPADTIISRDDAKLLEMRYYRTGKYCREGHNGFRLTGTGACVDCMQ